MTELGRWGIPSAAFRTTLRRRLVAYALAPFATEPTQLLRTVAAQGPPALLAAVVTVVAPPGRVAVTDAVATSRLCVALQRRGVRPPRIWVSKGPAL